MSNYAAGSDSLEDMYCEMQEKDKRIAELEDLLKRTVPNLSTIVRMPNAEYVADAHNRAVEELRKAIKE